MPVSRAGKIHVKMGKWVKKYLAANKKRVHEMFTMTEQTSLRYKSSCSILQRNFWSVTIHILLWTLSFLPNFKLQTIIAGIPALVVTAKIKISMKNAHEIFWQHLQVSSTVSMTNPALAQQKSATLSQSRWQIPIHRNKIRWLLIKGQTKKLTIGQLTSGDKSCRQQKEGNENLKLHFWIVQLSSDGNIQIW